MSESNEKCVRTFTHNQGLNGVGMIQNNNLLFKKENMIGSLFSNPFHFICVYSSSGFVCSIMHIMANCGQASGKALKFATLSMIYPISQCRMAIRDIDGHCSPGWHRITCALVW